MKALQNFVILFLHLTRYKYDQTTNT